MTSNTNSPTSLSVAALAAREALEIAGFSHDPTFGTNNSEFKAGPVTWNPSEGSVKYENEGTLPIAANATKRFSANVDLVQKESISLGQVNRGNNTEFTMEGQLWTGARASGGAKSGSLSLEADIGTRSRYQVSLPGANQPAQAALRVNPFDPTTIPPGGRVTLDGQNFTQSEMNLTFRNIAMQTKVTHAAGASFSVTRLDERHVQVTMGPTQAVEAFNAVGITAGFASALIGRQDSLGVSTISTARFDLAGPNAQAAYRHFTNTGEIAHNTPGVTHVATMERVDITSQARMKLEVGPVAADLGRPANSSQGLRIARPGSEGYTIVEQYQYSGNAPLSVVRQYDAHNAEKVGERLYQLRIDTNAVQPGTRDPASDVRHHAQLLNRALTGSTDGPVQPGQSVTLTFSEAQMQALMAQGRAVVGNRDDAQNPLDRLIHEEYSRQKPELDSFSFATRMVRDPRNTPYNLTTSVLSRIGDRQPIDADIQVEGTPTVPAMRRSTDRNEPPTIPQAPERSNEHTAAEPTKLQKYRQDPGKIGPELGEKYDVSPQREVHLTTAQAQIAAEEQAARNAPAQNQTPSPTQDQASSMGGP